MSYKDIINRCLEKGQTFIPENLAYQICREFDIAHPPYALAANAEECVKEAESIGFPVVLKIVSPQVVHKSDVGGVLVGLSNVEEIEAGYQQLLSNVEKNVSGAEITGVLVQKAMPKGVEVVSGGLENQQFGPVVMFGSGGVLVEVLNDVAFRLAPFSAEEAKRQISETMAAKVLAGVRGSEACNLDALANLLVNTGRLMAETPEMAEIDFNPVLAYPDGCIIVDARMILKHDS